MHGYYILCKFCGDVRPKNDPVVVYTQRIWLSGRLNLTLHVAYYDKL